MLKLFIVEYKAVNLFFFILKPLEWDIKTNLSTRTRLSEDIGAILNVKLYILKIVPSLISKCHCCLHSTVEICTVVSDLVLLLYLFLVWCIFVSWTRRMRLFSSLWYIVFPPLSQYFGKFMFLWVLVFQIHLNYISLQIVLPKTKLCWKELAHQCKNQLNQL